MFEKVLNIQYLNVRNNYCYLSSNVTKNFGSYGVVKLSHGDYKPMYFSLDYEFSNVSDDTIGINSFYAKLLQIEEGVDVMVTNVDTLPKVQSFTIHPVRADDFHVLDLLKTEVENCVLKQTKVVNEGQELVIWIGNNLYIPVKVVSVEPSRTGLLDNLTELIILPLNREIKVPTKTKIERELWNDDIFNITKLLTEGELLHERKIQSYFNNLDSFNGRLVPCEPLKSSTVHKYLYDFSVFIFKNEAPLSWQKLDTFKHPLFSSIDVTNNSESKTIFVRIFLIEENVHDCSGIREKNIFVHESLFKILDCKIGADAILTAQKRISCDKILIHSKIIKNLENVLKDYLANISQHQEFVLNADIPIVIKDELCCSLKFEPQSRFCCVDDEFLRKCKYKAVEDFSVMKLPIQNTLQKDDISVSSLQQICDSIVQNLSNNIVDDEELTCSLITGNIGCGKSMLINKISHLLGLSPLFLHCETVRCKTLKGKSVDSLHKVFVGVFENLILHKPSVLFIDDLHVLCENIAETDAQIQNVLHYNRTSEMLYSLFECITSRYPIGIIATVESTEKLNKHIYNSRGCYLFGDVHNMEDLTKDDRSVILCNYLERHSCDLDFDELAQKTEGYVFQDLFDFSQKAIFHSIKDDPENRIVTKEHCETVLSQMTILSLSDIKLHSHGDNDFSDIGGMINVKLLLTETLMWPLKYSSLFDSAPIRLQSGLLLYGPPGTGKTLLAGAAAKEFGIRLISIKGPELLSKYIGASEQAVRNIFVQAQNAKPCILFFDEFDSLAPRRGHDITGVTDRVVNQLLTQMDGVESLTGVFVIAATSRPDLLDPALLRPGRLDKQIFCPLPDLQSRKEILSVLSRTLDLSEAVDLKEIAEKTDGFSGADLQSLLYTAQLSTMENLLQTKDSQDEEFIPDPISQEALRKALSNTKPSLSKDEKLKYDLVYSKFQGKKVEVTFGKPGSKASLA